MGKQTTVSFNVKDQEAYEALVKKGIVLQTFSEFVHEAYFYHIKKVSTYGVKGI